MFGICKKRFPYLKIIIEFSKKTQIDNVYLVTIFHNFIIIYLSQNEKNSYNRKKLKDEELKDINGNQNKDKTIILISDALLINQNCNAIVQAMWIDYQ